MKKNLFVLLAILVIGSLIAYFYHTKQDDKQVADHVYQQLVVIDSELDQMQESAQIITQQKQINMGIVNTVKGINKDNFIQNKQALLDAVGKASFNPVTQMKLESEISATDNKNVKEQLKLIKDTLRELKYQHNQEISKFNDQIGNITSQLANIQGEISQIKGSNLQDLETAKLKFISEKLARTARELHEAFYKEVVDDVLDTIAADSVESK